VSRGKLHANRWTGTSKIVVPEEAWPLCGIALWQGATTREREQVTCKTCLRLLARAAEPGRR
jgi:hypothetical protein